MNVAYHGPIKDYSGYGEANRNYVAALAEAGINVIPQLVSYTPESSDFGSLGKRIASLFRNTGKYKIKIMHTTPNEFQRLIEPGVYHIGHFFWETDKVPQEFAKGLQLCDEIWTGSQANADAIRAGGVDKPVYILPQAIETTRKWPEKYQLQDFNGFTFYSIFEWTDRKNPAALLNAYWNEFQDGEDVCLLIKTYFRNFTLASKQMIRREIEALKRRSGLDTFPEVFLYLDLMDRRQISRLHMTGDVFASAHRGEGWGLPQVEAALAGKPMISTGYGGCHEYFTDGEDAVLLPYDMVPVRGMDHSPRWYGHDQNWAEVDHQALRGALRYAYSHQDLMAKKGQRARRTVLKNFSFKQVGSAMYKRLTEIEEGL